MGAISDFSDAVTTLVAHLTKLDLKHGIGSDRVEDDIRRGLVAAHTALSALESAFDLVKYTPYPSATEVHNHYSAPLNLHREERPRHHRRISAP